MRLRCLSILVFLPVCAMGGVMATALSLDQNCGSQTQAGEFAAAAAIGCNGSWASAVANFTPNDPSGDYVLQVEGSKNRGFPPVGARAQFDDWLLVNGGGASGYLLVRFAWIHTMIIVAPYRIQSSGGYFLGDAFSSVDPPTYAYLPFTAGVPVHMYGELGGGAGAPDRLDTPGEFSSSLSVYIRVTSQMVADPYLDNPMYVAGASVTAIPEPRVWWVVLSGLAALRLGRGRRASCGWPV